MHELIRRGEIWTPDCKRPDGLLRPVRLDPTGRDGPTRGQARSRRWRQVAHGWYVDGAHAPHVVEQRILEGSARLRAGGAVTGWASLRWRGARFFDGTGRGGRQVLPVPVLLGLHNLRADPRVAMSKEQLAPGEVEDVDGLACTVPERAIFDEMRRVGHLRAAVLAGDMALAAGLCDLASYSDYVLHRGPWTGIGLVRSTLPLLSERSRSPQESMLRLVWVLDAGLPPPLCNQPVFDRSGNLLGIPDLLDDVAGLVVEYDGGHHLAPEQRRADVHREHRFRDHGLEYVGVVGGDLQWTELVVRRLLAARSRAAFLGADVRARTLEPPSWWGSPAR